MDSSDSTQQILNVWLEGDDAQFSLAPVFEDPENWGVILADVVRLLGDAYREDGLDANATMNSIRDAFIAEFENPTL